MMTDRMAEKQNVAAVFDILDGKPYSGTEPPEPPMELVERVAKIEAAIPTLATKEDLVREIGGLRTELHKEIGAQTWRIIGSMLTFGTMLAAAVFFIARNVH